MARRQRLAFKVLDPRGVEDAVYFHDFILRCAMSAMK